MVDPDDGSTPDEVEWVEEHGDIPMKDVAFDEVSLMPSTMKSLKTISKFSSEIVRQSAVAIDAAIKQRLLLDTSKKLDKQFWGDQGDGTTTPLGLEAFTGVQEIDASGDPITMDLLLDMWGAALSADVPMEGLRFCMAPSQFIAARKLKVSDSSDEYLLTPDPTKDGVFRLWGSPVTVSKWITETTVFLVNFNHVAVARDLNLSVTLLRELYAQTDEVGIRVISRWDQKPLNEEAVIKATDVASALPTPPGP
jgi:HK97 family phage major capsid protein